MALAFKVASRVHNSIVLVVVAIVIEVARAPLLGQTPGLRLWIVALSLTFGGWLVTFEFLRHYRWRIACWV